MIQLVLILKHPDCLWGYRYTSVRSIGYKYVSVGSVGHRYSGMGSAELHLLEVSNSNVLTLIHSFSSLCSCVT